MSEDDEWDTLKIKLQEMNRKRDEEAKSSLKNSLKELDEESELLEKDRLANPHLALIEGHLWWLALGVKLGLVIMAISILVLLVAGG